MGTFSELLAASATARNSLLCVGLDPRSASADEARRECFALIDATFESAAAFKANSGFFEVFGAEGIAALRDVIAHVPQGTPLILDAKRGDIADSSEAYARAAFDALGAHGITVNPYVGRDGIAPFIARPERGAFVLCKTSNPGGDDFQALPVNGLPLFIEVAARAATWNTRGNVGLVVGATYPEALAQVRAVAPELWILLPGIGTQGGDLSASVAAGLRADGLGLLISASRSIAKAADPAAEARRLRDEINACRHAFVATPRTNMAPVRGAQATAPATAPGPLRSDGGEPRPTVTPLSLLPANPATVSTSIADLAHDLVEIECVRFGKFTMKSGLPTPIYIDLRRLVSRPSVLKRVARAYAEVLRGLEFQRVAGIPYAALPIATAIALHMDRPLIYPRREAKEYGTRAAIEGDYKGGERVVVIDDLATTGETKIETIQKLESAGLLVRDVVVLIDREQGATDTLAKAGYHMHAVVTLSTLLEAWRKSGAITGAQYIEVKEYLRRAA
jgi:uridine monophosphate synthetase